MPTQRELMESAIAVVKVRPGLTRQQIFDALGTNTTDATPQTQRKMRQGLLSALNDKLLRIEKGGYFPI